MKYPIRLSDDIKKANEYAKCGDYAKFHETLKDKFLFSVANPAMEELLDAYSNAYKSQNSVLDVKRIGNMKCELLLGEMANPKMEKFCLEHRNDTEYNDLKALHNSCYTTANYLGFVLVSEVMKLCYPNSRDYKAYSWVGDLPNMGVIREGVVRGLEEVVFITDNYNRYLVQYLLNILNLVGRKASVVDVDDIEGLSRVLSNTKFAWIIATTDTLEELSGNDKNIFRLTSDLGRADIKKLAVGYCGDYLEYLEFLYKEGKENWGNSNRKFSIVIPVRNAGNQLKYTIDTCLSQTYKGDYEILISDNSLEEESYAYEIVKQFDNEMITYIKTPRGLRLAKSFEYACLHASGEYVIALGADDGMLPWALETLDELTQICPDEEIIQWERGFYAWPGFNKGQQNQLVIPSDYKKGEYDFYYCSSADYIARTLSNPQYMYALPMLYINSCFKQTYLNTLMEKTGALWDGMCQDIYMGVVSACINHQILNMKYPLTVAGMSSGSVGERSNAGILNEKDCIKRFRERNSDDNVGGYCRLHYENLIPDIGTDVSTLYSSLLRVISKGILPQSYLTLFDWKNVFRNIVRDLNIKDLTFDKKIHQVQYAASLHGEEFLKWFNDEIYEPMLIPRQVEDKSMKTEAEIRSYQVGRFSDGSFTVDASEYGATNVKDAVDLFAKLSGLL